MQTEGCIGIGRNKGYGVLIAMALCTRPFLMINYITFVRPLTNLILLRLHYIAFDTHKGVMVNGWQFHLEWINY